MNSSCAEPSRPAEPAPPTRVRWRPARGEAWGLDALLIPFLAYMAAALLLTTIAQWIGALPAGGETADITSGAAAPEGATVHGELGHGPLEIVVGVACGNLAQAAGGGACLWILLRARRLRLAPLLFAAARPRTLAIWIGGVFLLSMGLCYVVLWVILQVLHALAPNYQARGHQVVELIRDAALPAWSIGLLWVGAVLIAPLAEELFFRGVLQTYLLRLTGRRAWAVAVTALLFGAAHATWDPPQLHAVAPLALLGVLLGVCYERTDSLAIPMGVHALFNAATMFAVTLGLETG